MGQRVRDVTMACIQQNREFNGGGGGGGGGGSSSGGAVAGEAQVIRWERFLPRRILRVLLVENDDSTRHIVTALLRKCSYQVAAVADGLKAWKVLKEQHYNFDLVLTEVVMPSLSGIGLLSKIMSNEICKNIPVIMMSSHDSMGIVFNCMLKGAADFLVKPVRKNELKNLWQHVWRKYCSSKCGDGSENGNSNDTKLEVGPINETASNHGSSNAGNRCADSSEESDSQSSCSRPEIEIQTESMQKQDEPVHIPSGSFSVKMDSKLQRHQVSRAEVVTSSIHEKGKAKDNSADIEIKLTLSIHKPASTENGREENSSLDRSPYCECDPGTVRSKNGGNSDPGQNNGMHLPSNEVVGYIRTATTDKCSYQVLEDTNNAEHVLHESAKASVMRTSSNSDCLPSWELSLRSQLKCQDTHVFQEKHVLKHSEGSAFSRYVNVGSHLFCPRPAVSNSFIKTNECGSSSYQIYPSDENGRNDPSPVVDRLTFSHVYGGEASMQCQLSSGRNKDVDPSTSVPSKEDVSISHSPTRKAVPLPPHLQYGGVPVSMHVGAIPFQSLCSSYGTIFQPFFYPEPSVPFHASGEASKEIVAIPSKPSTVNCNPLTDQAQCVNGHLYYANHHHHQSMQSMDEQRANMEPIYHRATHAEKNTIANGSNGTCEEMGVAANTGIGIESGSDRDRFRREAALNKFRLKRKDRCFEKKVRYHNRQKLAEQRPRLKGQFVRQAVGESNCGMAESDE